MKRYLAIVAPAAMNVGEFFYDAFRDKVIPNIGSILYCDLLFGYMEHSGVYVGSNQIVELNKKGEIQIVSPKEFMSGGTSLNIYVSCNDTSPVGSEIIAERALSMVGRNRKYNFLVDNCHQFTSGCITGDFEGSSNFLKFLKEDANKHIKANTWRIWDKNYY